MSNETGRVVAVTSQPAGDEIVTALPDGTVVSMQVGDTTIYVDDAADFAEEGGYVQISATLTTDVNGVQILQTDTYAYSGIDDDLGAIFLSDPGGLLLGVAAGDPVIVFDPTTGTVAQEVIAHVALAGSSFNDDAVEATVDHSLIPFLPEGIREDGQGETVTLGWRDDELYVINVIDQSPGLADESGGWSLDASGANFDSLSVGTDFGAQSGSFDTLSIGDQDLQKDILSPLPLGVIAHVIPDNTTDTANVSAETIFFQINVGSVFANRIYKVSYGGSALSTPANAGDIFYTRIKYTTDGSVPTLTSGIMDRSIARIYVPTPASQPLTFGNSFFYLPLNDYDTINMAFTGGRNAGTGLLGIRGADPNLGFYVSVEDMGARTSVGGTMNQMSKATGTVPVTPPKATYTKSWTLNAGQSYDENGGQRDGDANTPDLYQGYYSGTHGNTRSAMSFDDAGVRAALAGSTISKITLTFRVKHSYQNAGMTVRIGQHNSTNLPSTWGGLASQSYIQSKTSAVEGKTYTVTLPNSVGNAFRDGTVRGLTFGPGPSTSNTYYGYMYGHGSGSDPKITITYTK